MMKTVHIEKEMVGFAHVAVVPMAEAEEVARRMQSASAFSSVSIVDKGEGVAHVRGMAPDELDLLSFGFLVFQDK